MYIEIVQSMHKHNTIHLTNLAVEDNNISAPVLCRLLGPILLKKNIIYLKSVFCWFVSFWTLNNHLLLRYLRYILQRSDISPLTWTFNIIVNPWRPEHACRLSSSAISGRLLMTSSVMSGRLLITSSVACGRLPMTSSVTSGRLLMTAENTDTHYHITELQMYRNKIYSLFTCYNESYIQYLAANTNA